MPRWRLAGLAAAVLAVGWALAMAALAAGSAATLAYVEQKNGLYLLRFWHAAQGRVETVDVMVDRPQAIVWAGDRRLFATVRRDGIYVVDYGRRPYVAHWRGEPPPDGSRLVDAWFNAGSSALLVVAASSASTTAPGRTRCTHYEAGAGGPWRKLQERLEDEGAGAAACEAWADRLHAGSLSASSVRRMRAYRCAERGSLCAGGEASLPRGVLQQAQRSASGVDDLRVVAAGKDNLLLAGVALGDTPHFVQPLYRYDRARSRLDPLRWPTSPQLQLGRAGPWLLAASEYRGEDPVVIELATGRQVFRAGGWAAVWVPASDR